MANYSTSSRFQDLHLNQQNLYNEYLNTFLDSITEAHKLIWDEDNNVDNRQFAINEAGLNNTGQLIQSVEQYWWDDVINTLQENAETFQEWINNISTFPREVWVSGQLYEKNQIVSHDGNIYLCINNTEADTDITDTTAWVEIPIRGDKGFNSFGIVWNGQWQINNSYKQYDCVFVQTDKTVTIYVANVDITDSSVTPDTSSQWTKVLVIERNYLSYTALQPSEPIYPYNESFLTNSSYIIPTGTGTIVWLMTVINNEFKRLNVGTTMANTYVSATTLDSSQNAESNIVIGTAIQNLYSYYNL